MFASMAPLAAGLEEHLLAPRDRGVDRGRAVEQARAENVDDPRLFEALARGARVPERLVGGVGGRAVATGHRVRVRDPPPRPTQPGVVALRLEDDDRLLARCRAAGPTPIRPEIRLQRRQLEPSRPLLARGAALGGCCDMAVEQRRGLVDATGRPERDARAALQLESRRVVVGQAARTRAGAGWPPPVRRAERGRGARPRRAGRRPGPPAQSSSRRRCRARRGSGTPARGGSRASSSSPSCTSSQRAEALVQIRARALRDGRRTRRRG